MDRADPKQELRREKMLILLFDANSARYLLTFFVRFQPTVRTIFNNKEQPQGIIDDGQITHNDAVIDLYLHYNTQLRLKKLVYSTYEEKLE